MSRATSLSTELATLRREPRVWSLVGAAATRPRNSFVLAFVTLIGLMVLAAGMPMSGLGVITGAAFGYALLVLRDLFDPTLITEVYGLEAPSRARLLGPIPDDLSLETVAEPHRDLVGEIRAAYTSLRRHQERAPRELPGVFERCAELAKASTDLAKRGAGLFDYLSQHALPEVAGDLERLDELIAASDDPRARSSLETTARTRRDHLASLQQIQRMFDRITAQLAMIHSWMQLVESRLVELDAVEDDLSDTSSELRELSDLLAAELAGYAAIDELCELAPRKQVKEPPR